MQKSKSKLSKRSFIHRISNRMKHALRRAKLFAAKPLVAGLIGLSALGGVPSYAFAKSEPPAQTEQVINTNQNNSSISYSLDGRATITDAGAQFGPSADLRVNAKHNKTHHLDLDFYGGFGAIKYLDYMYVYGTGGMGLDWKWYISNDGKNYINLSTFSSGIITNFYDKGYFLNRGSLTLTHTFNQSYWFRMGGGGYAGVSVPNFALADINFWVGMSTKLKYLYTWATIEWIMAAKKAHEAILITKYRPYFNRFDFGMTSNPAYLRGFVVGADYNYDVLNGHYAGLKIGYEKCFGIVCVDTFAKGGVQVEGRMFSSPRFNAQVGLNVSIRSQNPYPNAKFNTTYETEDIGYPPELSKEIMHTNSGWQNAEQKQIYTNMLSMLKDSTNLSEFVNKLNGMSVDSRIKYMAMFAQILEEKGYAYTTLNDLLHGHFFSNSVKQIANTDVFEIYEKIRTLIMGGHLSNNDIAVCGGIHELVAYALAQTGLKTYTFTNNSKWGKHVVALANNGNDWYIINYGEIIKANNPRSLIRLMQTYSRDQGNIPQFSVMLYDGKTRKFVGKIILPEMKLILGAGGMDTPEIQRLNTLLQEPESP